MAALRVDSTSTTSIKNDLGTMLARSFKTSAGEVTPSEPLSWRHEYRDTDVQTAANFTADTGGATSFTTRGATVNKDTGVLVLGSTLARSENLTLTAHDTLEAAHAYTAQTGFQYHF